jgi:alpha-amylase/alpha-mannosidase (GH57 family)
MPYLCVHGHFYQPPRENPWLEAIEPQDSAYPYHDWNERVSAESYAPNGAARIQDAHDRLIRVRNNYRDISFNFGPTLLSWMRCCAPSVYDAVREADRESIARYGRGSAIAQVYNHVIMPLANEGDKRTQVLWGIADFEFHFQRKPEGMWLAETAADLASVEALAEHGIQFTILAPRQAAAVQAPESGAWIDVSGSGVDPKRPYRVDLPSGRSITVFFYDGPVSQAVAFERLLNSGETFARRIVNTADPKARPDQLLHIATDGETYGHHHRFGEMALAYAMQFLEESGLARITNYSAYLAQHPATWRAQIFENSSWSCAHGVERWRSDCSCSTGGKPGWRQHWRAPLRHALDAVRDRVQPLFEVHANRLLKDPSAARDAYIHVILDRSIQSRDRFLAQHAGRPLTQPERVQVWKLLELQRNLQLMYSSCGWFFDDIAGLEGQQVLYYAARAIQLAEELFADDFETSFAAMLAKAPSNDPRERDGARVYEQHVLPLRITLADVAAHFAITSIFRDYRPDETLYCYQLRSEAGTAWRDQGLSLVTGRVCVTSLLTEESQTFLYSALHLSDHNVECRVRPSQEGESYSQIQEELQQAFRAADVRAVLSAHSRHFSARHYTLRNLFRDDQRAVVQQVLQRTIGEAETAYRRLYDEYSPLLRFYADLEIPLPPAFNNAARFAIESGLREWFERPATDASQIRDLLDDAEQLKLKLDPVPLEYSLRTVLETLAARWSHDPDNLSILAEFNPKARLIALMPFSVGIRQTQNLCYRIMARHTATHRTRAAQGHAHSADWLREVELLAGRLKIRWPILDQT